MNKNLKATILIIVAIALLYIANNKYSSYNMSKSIQACIIGQKQLSPEMTFDEIEKICVDYVQKKVNK